jgi:peptidoglycan/xylan/chitin deacetylase (PgdA/CDA1 family)
LTARSDLEREGAPVDRTLAVLSYHKIGEPSRGGWETWYYVPESTFVEQLAYLAENGWHVIDVSTFIGGLGSPESLADRSALLTFDDGYRSVAECALPRMAEFGYPGVVFVPTDYIGGVNGFDANTSQPVEPICDWKELEKLERDGIAVQSHGASHRTFSELGPAELEDELVRSKATLEEGLGGQVEVFAFPYGDAGVSVRETQDALRRSGYRAACLYGGEPLRLPVPDPYRLTRLAMGSDTDLAAELR